MKRNARGYAGFNKVRKTLTRAEPEMVKKLNTVFEHGAETIQFDAIMNAHAAGLLRTGEMIEEIKIKYGRKHLTAVIGPGADRIKLSKSPFNTTLYITDRDKRGAWQFFKGYWAEFGTKGDPDKNMKPQRATPFMQPAFDANKDAISRDVRKEVHGVIVKLSKGDGV